MTKTFISCSLGQCSQSVRVCLMSSLSVSYLGFVGCVTKNKLGPSLGLLSTFLKLDTERQITHNIR